MGTRVLPDMYTLIPRACGPRDLGVHIRQNTRAHVVPMLQLLNVYALVFCSVELNNKK